MAASRQAKGAGKTVDPEDIELAVAKAVYDGDIVNFRMLFMPFSPARATSTESFDMPKYAYLLPDKETQEARGFNSCLALVRHPMTITHIRKELEANRPAQLPWELVLALGDQAVRAGKYSSAGQAYELLRIRARMQQTFFDKANAALDEGNIPRAVRGYVIATGLGYDYAAFPEPLPVIPDFQTRALMLHAEYPGTPEACLGMRDTEALLRIALAYLLLDPEAAARLDARPVETRLAFLKELVRLRDPKWDEFLERYRDASDTMQTFADRMGRRGERSALTEELEKQMTDDPREIPARLIGRTIRQGEWWQYLKEVAYEHPAGVLFVARQAVGDTEILVPRHAPDSPVARILGLSA